MKKNATCKVLFEEAAMIHENPDHEVHVQLVQWQSAEHELLQTVLETTESIEKDDLFTSAFKVFSWESEPEMIREAIRTFDHLKEKATAIYL